MLTAKIRSAGSLAGVFEDFVEDLKDLVDGGGKVDITKFDPDHPFTSIVKNAEIRTTVSPPITVDGASILKNGGRKRDDLLPNALKQLKPTVIIRSPVFGTKVIAPAGIAGPDEWKENALKAALLGGTALLTATAIVFVAGFWFGKRRGMSRRER